jgi:hypothetical protein
VITADSNPFRVQCIEALEFRAPGFSWDGFLARLADHDYRGAIVGPHGSGKTTLLLETQQRLEAQGIPVYYGFLNEATHRKRNQVVAFLRDIPRDTVFFLDGAEQLDPITWRWVQWRTRRLRGFVVTTHEPGRLPTLYTTDATETLLRELLEELAPEEVEKRWDQAQEHFQRTEGNIRDVFFALYDGCARGGT